MKFENKSTKCTAKMRTLTDWHSLTHKRFDWATPMHEYLTFIRTQQFRPNSIEFSRPLMGEHFPPQKIRWNNFEHFFLFYFAIIVQTYQSNVRSDCSGCQYWNVNLFGLMRSQNIISKIISKCQRHGKHSFALQPKHFRFKFNLDKESKSSPLFGPLFIFIACRIGRRHFIPSPFVLSFSFVMVLFFRCMCVLFLTFCAFRSDFRTATGLSCPLDGEHEGGKRQAAAHNLISLKFAFFISFGKYLEISANDESLIYFRF